MTHAPSLAVALFSPMMRRPIKYDVPLFGRPSPPLLPPLPLSPILPYSSPLVLSNRCNVDRERAPSDDRWEQRWRRLKGDGETNSASFSGMSTAAAIRPVRWTGDMGKEGGREQADEAERGR